MRARLTRAASLLFAAVLLGCAKSADQTAWAVYEATLSGDLETLRELIEKDPALAQGSESAFTRKTPLHYANSARVVEILIDAGARLDAADVYGHTPLHTASGREIVEIMLRRGADVKARGGTGLTPLHTAVYPDVADALLDHRAGINERADHGVTPLYSQTLDDRVAVMRLLLERGADPSLAETEHGLTPLHWAAAHGAVDSARTLIDGKAPVDARDKNGAAPLALAVEHDRPEMVRLLLEGGADPKAVRTPAKSPAVRALLRK